jgi:hypothetical protein
MARQAARRHQRERLGGIVVVCLGLVVLAIAIIALREPNGHVAAGASDTSNVAHQSPSNTESPSGSATKSSDTSSAPATAQLKSVPLVVLNNSSVANLASEAAQQFESGGWTVTHIDDLNNDILSPCAYYDPTVANAKQAALALQAQFPGIDRVKPKFPELPSGPVVVVLTGDYSTT